MSLTEVIVIGAGQAGLSISNCLKGQQIDHLVFEKGRVGEVWQSQRWDSFRMNTPNWANMLPGEEYDGDYRERFESAGVFAKYLEKYTHKYQLPVIERAEVISVEKDEEEGLFSVDVKISGELKKYRSRQVVVASGIMNKPKIPAISNSLPSNVLQLHASTYKNPQQLPAGSILIVGSAQSGCQIAEELLDEGRKVFLSAGKVGRFPRRYRGRDIIEWIVVTSFIDQRPSDLPDLRMMKASQGVVSGVGPMGKSQSLQWLHKRGALILGHLRDFTDGQFHFDDDAEAQVRHADEFSMNVKNMIEKFINEQQMDVQEAVFDEGDEPDTTCVCVSHATALDFQKENISTVIWTTGFTADFSWLKFPVLDEEGMPLHKDGISSVSGLYFLGFPWLRSRKSGIIYGMKEDSAFIASCVSKSLRKAG